MTAETHPIEKEQLMAYLDGELVPDEAARVALHLEQCAACAELASDLRGVSSRLLAWNVEPAPKSLSDSVLAALNTSDPREENSGRYRKHHTNFVWKRLLQSKWTWATAGIAIVALSLAGFVTRLKHQADAFPQPATREEVLKAMDNAAMSESLESPGSRTVSGQAVLPPPPPPVDTASTASSTGPMIARTAMLNVSAKDFDAARVSLDRIVHAHQGYISSLNASTEKGAARSLNAKLAVPAAQFEATLADLRALGRVGQEQQSSEEVTSQIVDLDARLKNARETESQLAEILRSRAGKVGDVLEVEKEMARVRGEIEVMQADQKQLRDRVAFASIELNLSEEYQAQLGDVPWSVGRTIRNAFVDGYHAAADGLLGVCVFLLHIAPSLLVWGLIFFWPARWAWRRWRNSRAGSVVGA